MFVELILEGNSACHRSSQPLFLSACNDMKNNDNARGFVKLFSKIPYFKKLFVY